MNCLDLLKLTPEQKIYGIWLEEEYDSNRKRWWYNNQIQIRFFSQWKNDKLNGIYKYWNHEGELIGWKLYENDEIVKDYLK